jgi:nicotinate-nucleotide adenylyltransferase
LRALVRRYPRRRFIWLMGADNLAQFHRWKDWRAIARAMPIAVIAVRAMMRLRWRAPPWYGCADGAGGAGRNVMALFGPMLGQQRDAALNASFPHDPLQGAPALIHPAVRSRSPLRHGLAPGRA